MNWGQLGISTPLTDPPGRTIHKPLEGSIELSTTFTGSTHPPTPRTISKYLTFQHNKLVYQLQQPRDSQAFRAAPVLVLEDAYDHLFLEDIEHCGLPLG